MDEAKEVEEDKAAWVVEEEVRAARAAGTVEEAMGDAGAV